MFKDERPPLHELTYTAAHERVPEVLGFRGFQPLRSNWVYCPNQFFDVCLPYRSRGCVRLVGYLIRRSLGYRDEHGDPMEPQVRASYLELIHGAGISRGALRDAIDEALKWRFIRCVRKGRAKAANKSAINAEFELCWDERDGQSYVTDPEAFKGFSLNGSRTDIPDQFFDVVLPYEPLTVTKVVGVIVRNSIGRSVKYGSRRTDARLSFTLIQRFAKILNRTTLSESIQLALEHNYIKCVEQGVFDPNAGRESKPAVYALRWEDDEVKEAIRWPIGSQATPGKKSARGGSPRVRAKEALVATGSKGVAGSVQKTYREARHPIGSKNVPAISDDRFKKRTGIGSKNRPENRFRIRTDIKTTSKTTPYKQQGSPAAAGVVEAIAELKKAGFNTGVAARLAEAHPAADIVNQIEWLRLRNPTQNSLGMLRRAIEENWPRPVELGLTQVSGKGSGRAFVEQFYAARAGSTEAPAAKATTAEVAAADAYLGRLLMLWPDEGRVETWAGEFGRFVQRSQENQRNKIAGFALALRVFGDAYLMQLKQSRQRLLSEAAITNRLAEEGRLKPEWLAYLRERETDIRRGEPARFAGFETDRAEKRQGISRLSKSMKEPVLKSFDSETTRLQDFQKFFRAEVMDFWTWYSRRNSATA